MRGRERLVLVTLLVGTFVTGSAEMLTAGLLLPISAELHVSVATAGSLFTAYALGLAVVGPLLTVATLRQDRRRVLVVSMALFAVMVAAPAVLPGFGWFVATRVVAGALQGMFLAAAFTTATAVAAEERAGRAVAVVIAGFSVSTVVGVPLAVLVGSAVGWRTAVLLVGGWAVVATGLLIAAVPSLPGARLGGAGALRQAVAPPVLAMLTLAVVLFAASGAVMSYLVPVLELATGFSGPLVSVVLVAYGLANVAGSFLGGRLADADAARALVIVTLGLVGAGAVMVGFSGQPVVAVGALIAWAIFGSSAPASVQHRSMSLAGPAAAVVAPLPASAASAGLALGSATSGVAFAAHGPAVVMATGTLIAACALGAAVLTRRLRPAARHPARSLGEHLGVEVLPTDC